jgi:hypothetical protein
MLPQSLLDERKRAEVEELKNWGSSDTVLPEHGPAPLNFLRNQSPPEFSSNSNYACAASIRRNFLRAHSSH